MAQYLTVARPYAKAIFEIAKLNENDMKAWSRILQVLGYIMCKKQARDWVSNPKITATYLKEIIQELLKEVVANDFNQLGSKVENLIQLLIKYKRLLAVPDISVIYLNLVANLKNITNVEVISAFDVDESQKENLKVALKKRFSTDVSIRFNTDKNLIGGAVIRTDKIVIDGSIKGKLENLYQSLISV